MSHIEGVLIELEKSTAVKGGNGSVRTSTENPTHQQRVVDEGIHPS